MFFNRCGQFGAVIEHGITEQAFAVLADILPAAYDVAVSVVHIEHNGVTLKCACVYSLGQNHKAVTIYGLIAQHKGYRLVSVLLFVFIHYLLTIYVQISLSFGTGQNRVIKMITIFICHSVTCWRKGTLTPCRAPKRV